MNTTITRDYSWTRQPKPAAALTKEERAQLISKLTDRIERAMFENYELRIEAIVEGRIGLNEMSDQELIDFAEDCWDITL